MALGAIAGSQKDVSNVTATQNVTPGEETAFEKMGQAGETDSFKTLSSYTDAGPGQADVTNSLNATRSFADLLKQYSASGGLPTDQDISSAQGIVGKLFAPQKTALEQSFTDQNTQAQRLSAQLGRPVNDPIIQAKLRTGFINQTNQLNSEQTAAGQGLALSLPGQRIGYAGQSAQVLGGLATQAFQNRAALFQYGSSIQQNQQNFRLQTAQRTGGQLNESGGGFKGAVTGAFGEAGAFSHIIGLGGGGGNFAGSNGNGGGGGSNFGGSGGDTGSNSNNGGSGGGLKTMLALFGG